MIKYSIEKYFRVIKEVFLDKNDSYCIHEATKCIPLKKISFNRREDALQYIRKLTDFELRQIAKAGIN